MTSSPRFLMAALRCEIDELEQLARTSELVGVIGRLVHALQRERGISNVWLASHGRRFAAERAAQAADSLCMEEAVRAGFDRLEAGPGRIGNGTRLFSRIAGVLPGLDAVPALRRRVAALETNPADATAVFVKLIAGLLAVVFEAADAATSPEISRLLVAMFNFMQGKEFAGQERACGAAAFGAGRNEVARQQQWLHLIDAQERCFRVFAEFSGAQLGALWRGSQPRGPLAELERLRRIACAAPAGVPLDTALSEPWFDCATRRIDAMKTVEERLAADLRALCAQKTSQARADLAAHQTLLAEFAAGEPDSPAVDPLPATAPTVLTLYGRQLERSILELVHEQSHRLQAMSDELDTVRAALNGRKLVERAKGLLMAHRGLSEQDAHKMLSRTAMNQGRRLVEVAESVLAMAEYLPPGGAAH